MRKLILMMTLAALGVTGGCAKKSADVQTEPQTQETAADPVKYVVRTLPASVKGEDVVSAIAENYKGKVVLIDFWATWCPPCRRAMKEVDAIKPELAKKGCVFVYITGETSPQSDWEEMIKGIAGDHYRLTEAQWGSMLRTLNVPGIPAYLLLGKDGKHAYDNLSQGGYPGNEVLANQIEVALTK